jgi:hypothetical protein
VKGLEVLSKAGTHLYGTSLKIENQHIHASNMIHLIQIYTLSFECLYCKFLSLCVSALVFVFSCNLAYRTALNCGNKNYPKK